MSVSAAEKIKELEKAIQHLQKTGEEQYEDLSNKFSNRIEAQLNLLKYLFNKYQAMKEFTRSFARESGVEEKRLNELWVQAKERVASATMQDEMLEELKEGLGKDNGGN